MFIRANINPTPVWELNALHLSPQENCWRSVESGETWGFLYDLVGFPIRYVSYCILMYLAVYLDVSRSYTLRYTKIHQDTSRYICIYFFGYHGNVSYLGVFTIHLGYI